MRHPVCRCLFIGALLLLVTAGGCRKDSKPLERPMEVKSIVERVEEAHGKSAWYAHRAVQVHLTVEFGGALAIDGTMTCDPSVGRSRIENHDGTVMVFDGQHAWVAAGSAPIPMARFHLLTWPYFMAVPFKLRDPGTRVELVSQLPTTGVTHPTLKLTFARGTGDTPDDWYLLHVHPRTNLIDWMAYVVTYGKKRDEDPGEPHAIVYDHFVTVDGVTLATDWTFRKWSHDRGVHGEPIGRASIRDVRFIDPPADFFVKPTGAKEDPLPRR